MQSSGKGAETLYGYDQRWPSGLSICFRMCYALSLVRKDTMKLKDANDLFKNVLQMAPLFKNVHPANHLLQIECKKITPSPKTVKMFSLTRWNECTFMFRSVLDCRKGICYVFSNEITILANEDALLDISDTK